MPATQDMLAELESRQDEILRLLDDLDQQVQKALVEAGAGNDLNPAQEPSKNPPMTRAA